jgi:hypothetical protein
LGDGVRCGPRRAPAPPCHRPAQDEEIAAAKAGAEELRAQLAAEHASWAEQLEAARQEGREARRHAEEQDAAVKALQARPGGRLLFRFFSSPSASPYLVLAGLLAVAS